MMVLDENNYEEKIYSLTANDWHPLLSLIPDIENTSKFGSWAGGDKDERGYIQLPYSVPEPIVLQFLDIVYSIPIIIGFDWGAWDEGRNMAHDENFDFDNINLPTKCKLITAVVRNDRFCEGALVSAFDSGLVLRILKSIEKEVTSLQEKSVDR